MSKALKELKQNGFTLVREMLPPLNTLCVLVTPTARTVGMLTSDGNWMLMDPALRQETVLAWKSVQN